LRNDFMELAAGVVAVEDGHGEIEDDDVGDELGGDFEKSAAIGDLGDDFVFGFEEFLEAFGDQEVIISDDDSGSCQDVVPFETEC